MLHLSISAPILRLFGSGQRTIVVSDLTCSCHFFERRRRRSYLPFKVQGDSSDGDPCYFVVCFCVLLLRPMTGNASAVLKKLCSAHVRCAEPFRFLETPQAKSSFLEVS